MHVSSELATAQSQPSSLHNLQGGRDQTQDRKGGSKMYVSSVECNRHGCRQVSPPPQATLPDDRVQTESTETARGTYWGCSAAQVRTMAATAKRESCKLHRTKARTGKLFAQTDSVGN